MCIAPLARGGVRSSRLSPTRRKGKRRRVGRDPEGGLPLQRLHASGELARATIGRVTNRGVRLDAGDGKELGRLATDRNDLGAWKRLKQDLKARPAIGKLGRGRGAVRPRL